MTRPKAPRFDNRPPRRPEWQTAPSHARDLAQPGNPNAKLGVFRLEEVNGDPRNPVDMHLVWEKRQAGQALCGAAGPWVQQATGHEKHVCVPCASLAPELWPGEASA